MNIRLATLADFLEPIATWNPAARSEGAFQYVDLSAVDQSTKEIAGTATVACSEAPSRARQLIKAGDVLVSTVRPNLNGVAAVTEEFDGATASTGFCVLRPRVGKLSSAYLAHWVRSPQFIEAMVREATGASYPAVSDRIVKSSLIPLPPLDEQRRIAAILDKADALRRQRKRALNLLETLTQSIFLEMFGDPVGNPKGFRSIRLREVATFTSGGTPPKDNSAYWGGEIPWVSPKDMKVTEIVDAEDHVTESALANTSLKAVDPLAVLLVVRGMILAHTVPIGITRRLLTINQDMKALQFLPEVAPLFGLWCLKAQHGHILTKVDTAAHGTKRLDTSKIEQLPILVPPIKEQERFVAAAQNVIERRENMANALAASVGLFSSLQHRAFSGQL